MVFTPPHLANTLGISISTKSRREKSRFHGSSFSVLKLGDQEETQTEQNLIQSSTLNPSLPSSSSKTPRVSLVLVDDSLPSIYLLCQDNSILLHRKKEELVPDLMLA